MMYRRSAPEPPGNFRELVLLFALVAGFGILVTVAAIWATWDGGGVIH